MLVVEPAAQTRGLLGRILADASFSVRAETDRQGLIDGLQRAPPDLVLLDLDMPDVDGLELPRVVKAIADVPVIVLARARDNGIAGLEAGADDYVIKPVRAPELIARVRAHLRGRASRPGGRRLEFWGLVIDPARREALVDGRSVELRHQEFELLIFLASSPGRVFSRAQLLDQVWGASATCLGESTVTEHVRRIRDKIEADPSRPTWIHTVHRVGYRFERTAGKVQ